MRMRRIPLTTLLALLVVLIAVKLLLKPRPLRKLAKMSQTSTIEFWKKDTGKKQGSSSTGGSLHKPKGQTESPAKVEMLPPVPKTAHPLDPNAPPLKVVHLDLKGAPPKLKYLEQIFPLFSSLGATGVLLEYDDMFPYKGELWVLRSENAYSVEDIITIQNLAKLNKLLVIPLIQVLGRMEFVLKHERFSALREVEDIPNSLNPHAPGSQPLIQAMVTQVLDLHPDVSWFHIGAAEVSELGQSQDSKNWLHSNRGDIGKMFLDYVVTVARFIVAKRPGIRLLMWDDMMRKISPSTIKASGLPRLATPMMSYYAPHPPLNEIGLHINKYQRAGFKDIWFSSAFNGASGVIQRVPPLDHHMTNHLSWLKVMNSMSKYPSITFRGIVLTGRQRYDHSTVLRELLPMGIPSLAVCLKTLQYGEFSEEAQTEIQHLLGCRIYIERGICMGRGTFPGSKVYNMILWIVQDLEKQTEEIMTADDVKGRFSNHHRKHSYANPHHLDLFRQKLDALLFKWEFFLRNLCSQMEAIFFLDAEEWMDQNVNLKMDKLRKLLADVDRIRKF